MALIIGLAIPSTAFAEKSHARPKRAEQLCERLDCNERQREEITHAMQQLKKQHRAARQRMRDLADAVAQELRKARPDEDVLQAAYEKIERQRASLRDAAYDTAMSIHGVLNARQRETAAPMLARMLLAEPPPRRHGPAKDRSNRRNGPQPRD